MTIQFESAIVRLRTTADTIVGTGFLVTERQVLTCAHVVADAMDIPRDIEKKPAGTLHLDFPLVAPGNILTAQVILWRPKVDIAGLALDNKPPVGVQPARLVISSIFWNHAFRAFGFPEGYDRGVWASGVLRGRQSAGWVQIEDVKETGYWVQPGFSGTAVWDEQLNGVVGMAVAADTDLGIRAAFMIPANLLIEVWPQLAQRSLDADDLEYLHEQLAMLEAAQQNATDPHRFQPKIDELQAAIADWDGQVEKQRQRIANGLAAQRQQAMERSTQRPDEKRLRVVGRRPLDVADYFKDRERELVTIGQLLAEPTTRLASVIGHGGMGKTALACKVLRDLERHRWPHTDDDIPLDGIVYLSTRTAGIGLERLFLDCAKVLGGEQEKRLNAIWTNPHLGNEDKVTRLLEALSEGRYVILLDNMDDLLDDRGQLVDKDLRLFFEHSLITSHGARLLVTSRLALAFRHEVMHFDRQVKLLEGLPIADGVALLRELDPNGDYGLRDAPEEKLVEAVSLVHGVPRALEVMAGILANDPFASLTDVLEQFYEHEDVVRALIEENYKRLDDNARRVIEVLAVFKRPVPPLAVDYLLEPFAPGVDVPGIVRRLARTNFVSVDRATKTVTLHPIDQDYAYSQLPEDETCDFAYTRQALELCAADYYVQLRTLPETWQTIDDLQPQLIEFEHRVRAEDYEGACQVLELIDSDYLYVWGHYARLVEMREKLLGRLTDPRSRIANLGRLGLVYYTLGWKVERAIELLEESLAIAREIGDRRNEGIWLGNLGHAYRDLGQVERAIKFYERALAIAREIGDRRNEGIWLGSLGLAYRNLGHAERTIELYEQALAIAREIGDRRQEGSHLNKLGTAYRRLGRVEQAIKLYEEDLVIARKIGDRLEEGISLSTLGDAYRALGQVKRAIKCYEEALDIFREIGERWEEGRALGNLGNAYLDLGRVKHAIRLYEEALTIARRIGHRRGESYQLLGLGQTLLATGDLAEARRRCAEALALDMPETSYQAALTLGIILLCQGDPAAGDAFADAALCCQTRLDRAVGLYAPRYALAAALVGSAVCNPRWVEEDKRAKLLASVMEEYRQALEICAAPGAVHDAVHNLEMIHAAGVDGLEPVFALLEATGVRHN